MEERFYHHLKILIILKDLCREGWNLYKSKSRLIAWRSFICHTNVQEHKNLFVWIRLFYALDITRVNSNEICMGRSIISAHLIVIMPFFFSFKWDIWKFLIRICSVLCFLYLGEESTRFDDTSVRGAKRDPRSNS